MVVCNVVPVHFPPIEGNINEGVNNIFSFPLYAQPLWPKSPCPECFIACKGYVGRKYAGGETITAGGKCGGVGHVSFI